MAEAIHEYGWTAVPRDPNILLNGKRNVKDPQPMPVSSVKVPATRLATTILEYARRELREETFNHSMRVYYYGSCPLVESRPQRIPQC